jgi:DNA topoisomerase I
VGPSSSDAPGRGTIEWLRKTIAVVSALLELGRARIGNCLQGQTSINANRGHSQLRHMPSAAESVKAAKLVGLRYVMGYEPGILRRKSGNGFVYIGTNGKVLRDSDQLQRIRSLAIPPAWKEVWICSSAYGHLQAVGRDARGRKQYRYHARYREARDRTKFGHLMAFGNALPAIRREVNHDLRLEGLPRNKVLAAVVRLLDTTCMRIGNEEYVRDNNSFGLTTLRNRHVQIAGKTLRFRFRGKSGQVHNLELADYQLARIIKRCQELPGYELFEYLDHTGKPAKVNSEDVNGYLRGITGEEFTAKDFRTWAGTSLALLALEGLGPARSAAQAKRTITAAIKSVSQKLGNRPPACRKYYVHPVILDAYSQGHLCGLREHMIRKRSAHALRREELALLKLLSRDQTRQGRGRAV